MGNSTSMDEAEHSEGSYIVHYSVGSVDNSADPFRDDNNNTNDEDDGADVEHRNKELNKASKFNMVPGRQYEGLYIHESDSHGGGDDKTFDTITTRSSGQSMNVRIEQINGRKEGANTLHFEQKTGKKNNPKTNHTPKSRKDDAIETIRERSSLGGRFNDEVSYDTRDNDPIFSLASYEEGPSERMQQPFSDDYIPSAIQDDGLKRIATVYTKNSQVDDSKEFLSHLKQRSKSRELPTPNRESSKQVVGEISSYHSEDDYGGNVDLRFVEQFEATFNAFKAKHPDLVSRNPELVEKIRVLKLRKLLDVSFRAEGALLEHIEAVKKKKSSIADFYQEKLVEAARQKASKEIQLEREWKNMVNGFKLREGELAWKLLQKSRVRAIKHQQICLRNSVSVDPKQLFEMLPELAETQPIRDAVLGNRRTNNTKNVADEIKRCQVDNAFLSAEIDVLEKKVAYQEDVAKKLAWVDSVLLRLDDDLMRKLKQHYEKELKAKTHS